MIEPRSHTLPRPVRLAFGSGLAVYLGIAAWLVWRTSILEPYSDMFDWVVRWRELQAGGGLWRYLWAPHNFHHLVWTFAVLELDIRAFGASGYLFLAVGALCLAGTAALLAVVGAAAAGRGLRLVGGGGAAALSAMGCHVLDASADINTTYMHALFFAVAAIVLAEAPGESSTWRRGGALGCALAAGLGSAAGLAVWPAMLFAAWRGRRRGWAAIVLLSGAVFALLYLLGETATPQAGSAGAGAGRPIDAILLFFNYLALPWVRGAPAIGWILGPVVLITALAALAFKGRGGAPWPERAATGLIVFSLTTAVMAGAARNGAIAPGLVPMRYAVFLIPLHVGFWVLALPHLRRAWVSRPAIFAGTVVAGAALMLVHQLVMSVYAVRTADINLRLVADFRAGARSSPMLITIYSDLDRAKALSDGLRRDGFYQRELRADPPASSERGISVSSIGR